ADQGHGPAPSPPEDLLVEPLPLAPSEPLRVIHSHQLPRRIEHGRGRHHRSREAAAPRLVEPRHAPVARPPSLAFKPPGGFAGHGLALGLSALLDPGSLPLELAKVVKLCPPDLPPPQQLDAIDHRGVKGEDPLHADPSGDLPHGESGADASPSASDHNPLEDLDAFLLPLHDLQDRKSTRLN